MRTGESASPSRAEDRAAISIRVSAPNTVSLDFTRTQMQKIEDMLVPYRASGEAEVDACGRPAGVQDPRASSASPK